MKKKITYYDAVDWAIEMNFSFVPIKKVKDKTPYIEWKQYQTRKPTKDEIKKWKKLIYLEGIGIMCGKVSGKDGLSLEVIDLDNPKLYELFKDIDTRVHKTPNGGYHLLFFSKKENRRQVKYNGWDIDLLGNGGYFTFGEGYEVVKDNPILVIEDTKKLLDDRLPSFSYDRKSKDIEIFKTKIEEFKSKINFDDVLNYCGIKPKKIGKSFMALCPFHDDHKESLIINKDNVYCFACQKCWDAIGLVMEKDKLDFWSAIKKLEKITGVKVEIERSKKDNVVTAKRAWFDDGSRIFLEYEKGYGEYAFAYFENGEFKSLDTITKGNIVIKPLECPIKGGEVIPIVKMPNQDLFNVPLLSPEELFEEIKKHIYRYVDASELDLDLFTYYILFTWFYPKVNTVGYLRWIGDTGKGKTRQLTVVSDLCFYPTTVEGASSLSGIMRLHEKWKGTLRLDEADFSGDHASKIIKYLNLGFERNKFFTLSDKKNPRMQEFFDPFGPKLIAMRRPFRDNATESRVISVLPYETNRKDIPVILDDEYDKKTQDLRNKIAKFVLYYWNKVDGGKLETFENLDIEPRLRQMASPFSIIFQIWPNGLEKFKDYLLKRQKELKKERSQSWDGLVFNCVLSLARGEDKLPEFEKYYKDGKIQAVTPSMVAKVLKTTPKVATQTLRGIGFEVELDRIEVKEGEKYQNKLIRKYVVPNEKIWNEIIQRYYYDENGGKPEIPDCLKSKRFISQESVTSVTNKDLVTHVTDVTHPTHREKSGEKEKNANMLCVGPVTSVTSVTDKSNDDEFVTDVTDVTHRGYTEGVDEEKKNYNLISKPIQCHLCSKPLTVLGANYKGGFAYCDECIKNENQNL